MPKTWSRTNDGEVTCEKCGSIYRKWVDRYPMRDDGRFNCSVCGHEMDSWNSTFSPSYDLIERKENHKQ